MGRFRKALAVVFLLSPGVFFGAVFLHCSSQHPWPEWAFFGAPYLDPSLLKAAGASVVVCLPIAFFFLFWRWFAYRSVEFLPRERPSMAPFLVRLCTAFIMAVVGVYFWALGVELCVFSGGFHGPVEWPLVFVNDGPCHGDYWMRDSDIPYATVFWFVAIFAYYTIVSVAVPAVAVEVSYRAQLRAISRNLERRARASCDG